MMRLVLFITAIFVCISSAVDASVGDRSHYHQNCLKSCWDAFCEKGSSKQAARARKVLKFEIVQSTYLKYMGWDCNDECKYQCMWQTVDYFREIEKKQTVPQFYGKWPFVRIYGMLIIFIGSVDSFENWRVTASIIASEKNLQLSFFC